MTDSPSSPFEPLEPQRTPSGGPPLDPQRALQSRRGPIRNWIESISMAVLMAILLKYFALEAYVIPTPSMQPTLMGSPEAGESDRILVDKCHYLIHEPKRWDIMVFRYPVRQIQSYVKRCVGIGPETLRIAGGNLYKVHAERDAFETLRKPSYIQDQLWREIFPMRRRLERMLKGGDPDAPLREDDVLGSDFRVRVGRWSIANDGTWIVTPSPSGRAEINYRQDGARNDYEDGYDLELASFYRKEGRRGGDQAVQDLRIGFAITPRGEIGKLEIAIDIHPVGQRFALVIEKGLGVLEATRKEPGLELRSAPFDFALPPGETAHVRFAHLDDRLLLWRDHVPLREFVVDDLAIRQDLAVGDVEPRIAIHAKDRCSLADVRIERDLHYTRSGLPEDHLIEVPADHYFMMGDNTLGSADGRDWEALRIGVDKDGAIVDPETHPQARVLWGNLRPKPFGEPPHDDDNPVPLYTDEIVFIDEFGEIHGLKGRVDPKTWGGRGAQRIDPVTKEPIRVEFLGLDGDPETAWSPRAEARRFVRRDHIQGRPIARFMRSLTGLKWTAWIR